MNDRDHAPCLSPVPGMDEECSSYNPRDDGTFEADERFDEDEEEEEEEEEEERRRRPSNSGSDDRRRASFISDSVDECRPGLTCNMNTRCQQPDGQSLCFLIYLSL